MKKESNPLPPKGITRPTPPPPPPPKTKVSEPQSCIECKVRKYVTFTLVLGEKEAAWLKALVQNPIGCTPEEEPKEFARIRRHFWDALQAVEF